MKRWPALLLLSCAPASLFAQSIVCDGRIIGEGTTQAEVVAKCGNPAQVDHHPQLSGPAVVYGGRQGLVVGAADDVSVEVWTFNFGPNKLMQRVRFENGVVARIESLGYGF